MCLRPRLGGLGRPCPWRASIGSSSLRHHGEPVWLAVSGMVTHANGTAERRASEIMLKAKRKAAGRRSTARARVPPLYPLTRAHEGRADMSAVAQHDIDHRRLVEYQQVTVEWVVVAAFEAAALGVDLQQPVDGLRPRWVGDGLVWGRRQAWNFPFGRGAKGGKFV